MLKVATLILALLLSEDLVLAQQQIEDENPTCKHYVHQEGHKVNNVIQKNQKTV